MSVWAGWQGDLLSAAQLPIDAQNHNFLTDWHDNAYADCQFNPVDLSQVNPDSHDCKPFRGTSGRQYQKYDTHGGGIGAFAAQIGRNEYAALRAAIASGNPYVVNNVADVVAELKAWGSDDFAAIYAAYGGPPPKSPPHNAHTLGGWKDVRHSFNHSLPRALKASQRSRKLGLRELHRASKVKL